jgi:endoglycosylceramidase
MLADPAQQRAFDNFWANRIGPGGIGISDRFASMLAFYGRRFQREPDLLGYDIFNEPNAGTQWPTCVSPLGCPAFDAQLSAWYRKVLPVLRAADQRHLIWIEPNVFFDFAADTNLHHPEGGDRDVGFDFHTYCLGDGAAAALPPIPGNGPGCAIEETLNLNNAVAYGRRSGDALLDSEWGATSDPEVATRQAAEFDHYMLGDVFWDYRNLVHDLAAQPEGGNVDAALLAPLDRPFPPIVAGTPSRWQWDAGTDTFVLDYATTLPDGRSAQGMRTRIYIPRQHYPQGYRVVARGADVVLSTPTRIVLRNAPGAQSVVVTVTP